jgi:hypothetical protein
VPNLIQINVYPIKSVKGNSLEIALLQPRGLPNDRRWLLVDGNGRFLIQLDLPRMAVISGLIRENALILSAPHKAPLRVPLQPKVTALPIKVIVWGAEREAISAGDEADGWLSDFLQTRCRLAYLPDDIYRIPDRKYVPGNGFPGFVDGFPLKILGQSSLDDLNERLASPVPMSRFRPSLVVDGIAPYEEDTWKTVQIGSVIVDIALPCARCAITAIDQDSGERCGAEPMKTLSTYRMRDRQVVFGVYALSRNAGVIQVGDGVKVLE